VSGLSFSDTGTMFTFSDGYGAISYSGWETINLTTTALVIDGTAAGDTLVVNATSANSGTFQLNGGSVLPFSGITAFTFKGLGGADTLTINNPSGGMFGPSGG